MSVHLLRHPDHAQTTNRAVVGSIAVTLSAAGLVHLATGAPAPTGPEGAGVVTDAGGMLGFLVAGPLCGYLSDRYGARRFAVGGALVTTASFLGLMVLPVDFPYWAFALLTFVNGIGSGMFSSPNAAMVMNAVPPAQRGAP